MVTDTELAEHADGMTFLELAIRAGQAGGWRALAFTLWCMALIYAVYFTWRSAAALDSIIVGGIRHWLARRRAWRVWLAKPDNRKGTTRMSMRDLERAIRNEAAGILDNTKLRLKDIMEWRTVEFEPETDEVLLHLPGIGLWASFPKEADNRPAAEPAE